MRDKFNLTGYTNWSIDLDCSTGLTYIENGIEIIGNGVATIVSVDSNFINMNIVSGNVDLLEDLQHKYDNLYISGELWDKQAEFANQYFKDGSVAVVTGKLVTKSYEKNDERF